MQNQIVFVLKVFLVSAIASVVIKYGAAYLPNLELSEISKNWIAGIAVTLPVALYAIFLKWRESNY